MSFIDRAEAGKKLAEALSSHKGEDAVVLALPRGGVPVAAEVAAVLEAPLDLVLVRKLGVPFQPELAMGAVVDGADPVTVRNEDVIQLAGVSELVFDSVRNREMAEIERRRESYFGDRAQVPVKGRIAIVVDDGIATGATTRAALRAVRAREPKSLILAIPVGPTSTIESMRAEADDVVCLEAHEAFGAIGMFYRDFHQVPDEEVIAFLDQFGAAASAQDKR